MEHDTPLNQAAAARRMAIITWDLTFLMLRRQKPRNTGQMPRNMGTIATALATRDPYYEAIGGTWAMWHGTWPMLCGTQLPPAQRGSRAT